MAGEKQTTHTYELVFKSIPPLVVECARRHRSKPHTKAKQQPNNLIPRKGLSSERTKYYEWILSKFCTSVITEIKLVENKFHMNIPRGLSLEGKEEKREKGESKINWKCLILSSSSCTAMSLGSPVENGFFSLMKAYCSNILQCGVKRLFVFFSISNLP